MRIFTGILALILAVVLAITIGNRVPPETVAMAAGVVLGAAAAIPLSLILGLAAPRRLVDSAPVERTQNSNMPTRSYAVADGYANVRDYLPLVIISPAALQQASRQTARAAAFLDNSPVLNPQRQFRIVGEDAA